MHTLSLTGRRLAAVVIAGVLAVGLVQPPMLAFADTKPINEANPATPVTVSAEPLPTVQINGVVWSQAVIGNTVYVGGEFTSARPAGSAAGVNETPRANLLAYDIRTGVMIGSWAPQANAQVLGVAASPDGRRVYVAGNFTTINGQVRNRIAALDPTTGAPIAAFQPRVNGQVRAVVATADNVYFGGNFTAVSNNARTHTAAVRASDAAVLSWAPVVSDRVNAIAISPDRQRVAIGGRFKTVNGSGNPGYGLALLDASTGASLPMPANDKVRNAGPDAAILSMASDNDSLYVTGYHYGAGGTLEGTSRIDWNTGAIVWVEDCHGDTYSVAPMGDVIYTASHKHYCGNLPDGPPQTTPWTFHWANAFSKAVVGTLKGPDPYGYTDWGGTPAPNMQKWEPELYSGSYTGQSQAGWSVATNSQYVAFGGEFPRAGKVAQQGLVRYAVRTLAPNKLGPELSGYRMIPKATSFVRGTVRLAWAANWDRDNEYLTYHIRRNGVEIDSVVGPSSEWSRPVMGYLDTGLTPGVEYRYRLYVTDPWGNEARGDTVAVTVSSDGALSSYASSVLDDGATTYWRFGEDPAATGNVAYDWAGFGDARVDSGVTGGQAGAIVGDSNPASAFNGTTAGLAAATTAQAGPNLFTVEAWIKTTNTAGGKIIGFGNANTGNSSSYDRHVYMEPDGRLTFGVYPGTSRTVSSVKAYNDGQWHQVVASLSGSGMALYVDGRRVATRSDTTTGQAYSGFWRVGGDSPWSGAAYFAGQIDEVAIYPTALDLGTVQAHYTASGRALPGTVAPSDPYGKAVHSSQPDLYWRLAETSGTTAADATPNENPGVYAAGTVQGAPSGIGLAGDRSARFDGIDDVVGSVNTFANPTTYTEELWFRTTTTSGGKLIGFGNNQSGNSSNYDRHVYMLTTGQLRYGVWTGAENLVTSSASYNDDKWHYIVAQQSNDGMKLYVDSVLVGTNSQTGAQDYTGYWRIGGDTTWGGTSSNYFAGDIDEVAVYSRILTADERLDHFGKGGGDTPNVPPAADFTYLVNKRTVAFTAAGTDTDGTIASYLWNFGDGTTSNLANPQHVFATAGGQTVTLTVTDNEGATGVISKVVTTVANASPAAGFTFDVNKLTVAFTSTSTDSDGSIASYLWSFGDGDTSTAANPTHSFATAAPYDVKLTVTDNEGATSEIVKTVTTTANAAPTAAFGFTVSDLTVAFASTSTDSDGTVKSYLWTFGDGATSTLAAPSHDYAVAGTYQVTLKVTDDDGGTDQTTKAVTATAPPAGGGVVQDAFGRTVTGGFGSADAGGAWTRYGSATAFSVVDGAGQIRVATAGAGPRVALESVTSTNTEASVKVTLDKLPSGGGGFASLGVRASGGNDYRAKVKIAANGALTLYLVRVEANVETSVKSVVLASTFNYSAGSVLNIKAQAFGTSTTALKAKVWNAGKAEPAWQVETNDSAPAALQTGGGIGLVTYISGSATNIPVTFRFDDLTGTTGG